MPTFISSNPVRSLRSWNRRDQKRLERPMLPTVTRWVRLVGVRTFATHAKPHVHMPETAMLTNNGTHAFERKGWEYSAYMGMLGGPLLLYVGLSNVPETDSEVFAREEVLANRKGVKVLGRRSSGPVSPQAAFELRTNGEASGLNQES